MHRPMQACVPPVVLILDPGRIGIPDHHDGQQIRATDEVRGEVELRRQARVFAHPDERAVAPHDRNTPAPPRCTITSRLRHARGTENIVRCKPVGFSGGVKGASVSGHGITMFV